MADVVTAAAASTSRIAHVGVGVAVVRRFCSADSLLLIGPDVKVVEMGAPHAYSEST
jgi:hypothetical protein